MTTEQQAPTGAERRSRLRQYQVTLLERMQAARAGTGNSGRELGVQLGGRRCLLDLTQVGEIVPFQTVTAVPLSQDWYRGLANIRGSLVGVVDLARYMGEAGTQPGPDSRLVTFATHLGFNCAILAGRVLGLRKLDEMVEQPRDSGQPAWGSQQFTDREAQQWTRLDLGELVREARFLQVGL
jgi:twitching motility protein PilI